jgi:hypothetical protein
MNTRAVNGIRFFNGGRDMRDDRRQFGVECPNDWPMGYALIGSAFFVCFIFLLAGIT